MATTDKPLYEIDHPYTGPEMMYYASGHDNQRWAYEHDSWADFVANGEFGPSPDLDIDMNWLYRWDWNAYEEDEPGEEAYNSATLTLYFLLPRKGVLSHTRITGMTPEDEPAVREFLAPYAAYTAQVWDPFLTVKES